VSSEILSILKRINDSLVNRECKFDLHNCDGCCNFEQSTERYNIGLEIEKMMEIEVGAAVVKPIINFMGDEA